MSLARKILVFPSSMMESVQFSRAAKAQGARIDHCFTAGGALFARFSE